MGILPGWLNPFDVLIIFVLLGGAALGFMRGLVRMALSLVVFYVAAVLAMTFYDTVGGWVRYITFLPTPISEGIGFLLILAIV
ncbi:MAG TPA: CvpA family protein, partial [Anaerolineae bacterium]|nr:CvpA family protein [Anaerolineae bacterium]